MRDLDCALSADHCCFIYRFQETSAAIDFLACGFGKHQKEVRIGVMKK